MNSTTPRTPTQLESCAPFAAGMLLLGCGALAAAHDLDLGKLPGGPLVGASWSTALLVAGAGLGILFAAAELHAARREIARAVRTAQRAQAERDLALLQARRMRAQAEGLALMREIHRSTAIPEQRDRLHRILTLVGDLFEAREVALFAAVPGTAPKLLPAAILRTCAEEELFACFDAPNWERIQESSTGSGKTLTLKARDATLVADGCKLFAEGDLTAGELVMARVTLQKSHSLHDAPTGRQHPAELLESAMTRLDCGVPACRHALKALEQHRILREVVPVVPDQCGSDENLLLSVPLITDQRPVGVLRIRRAAEGFDGPAAETFQEMLVESGKHIALALKKDQDDRNAITDQLTGLFIKRHFLALLEDLRTQAAASSSGATHANLGKPFALVLLDIDHFKKVNDTHGHLSGDLVLKNVAAVLRKGLRTGDQAFRYGGEEMAVLMPGASEESAQQTAERLRVMVESAVFHGEKGQTIPITVSLGLALHRHGLTGEQLISRADSALYASKHAGRNRVTTWRIEQHVSAEFANVTQ